MKMARLGIVMTALVVLGLTSATAASAAPIPANVTCSVGSGVLDLNPGWGLTPAPMTASGRGTAAGCSGIVGRAAFSGVDATFAFYASGTASCSRSQGSGYFVLQLNTNPPQTVRAEFDFVARQTTGTLTGEANSVGYATAINPLEDCVNIPITKIRATYEPIYIVTI